MAAVSLSVRLCDSLRVERTFKNGNQLDLGPPKTGLENWFMSQVCM